MPVSQDSVQKLALLDNLLWSPGLPTSPDGHSNPGVWSWPSLRIPYEAEETEAQVGKVSCPATLHLFSSDPPPLKTVGREREVGLHPPGAGGGLDPLQPGISRCHKLPEFSVRPALPPRKPYHCFLKEEGPWGVQIKLTSQPTQAPSADPAPRGSRGDAAQGAGQPPPAWSRPWLPSPKREGMEVSFSKEHGLGQGPREPSGWTAPPSSLFMALWRLLSPLFCQTSSLLTSKSARHLANICQDSSLTLHFPHVVFVSSAWIWALCTDKHRPWGSGGAPMFC